MKTIIIYYTLEGNTKFAAQELAKHLNADILELQPEKPVKAKGFSKYIWGGKQVVMNEKPQLKPYDYKNAGYDLTILASPIWASNFAPAFTTFLYDNKIKGKVALLGCNDGGGCEKAFTTLKEKLKDNEIIATLDIISPLKNQEETREKVKKFSKQLL